MASVSSGKVLLSAVERLLTSNDALKRLVQAKRTSSKPKAEQAVAQALVTHFSRLAALLGGAAGALSMIPGVHWGALLAGGLMMDASLLLKLEVEMALSLSHLYGFDIDDPAERQLAFFLASVATHDERSGKSFLADVMAAEREAVWKYTPRRVGKMLVDVLATLALLRAGRGFARLIPLVGPLVGTAMNGVLTRKVGERCIEDLRTRRRLLGRAPRAGVAAKPAARRRKAAPRRRVGAKRPA